MHSSVIIPCYNEEQSLPAFFSTAVADFEKHGRSCEFIFVNDGSTDDTTKVLKKLIETYGQSGSGLISFRAIELSRNFGKESAMYAGLDRSSGDYVGFIDADLQQDPSLSCEMLAFLEDNPDYDCVAAVQGERKEPFFLRTAKRAYYKIFNTMGKTQLLQNSSDFRFFTRQVADALLSLTEQYRFSKGLFSWVGFTTHVITYSPAERFSGTSKWSFRKLVSYGWDGILAFSTWPLKLVMYCGVITALLSLALLAYDFFEKIAFGSDIPAFQLVLYTILLLGGIQMVIMGIFGEYMARTYIEAKRRPVYLIKREYSSKANDSDDFGH